MSDDFVHLFEKKTDVPIEQTKTYSEETFQYKTNTSQKTFIFDTPLILERY